MNDVKRIDPAAQGLMTPDRDSSADSTCDYWFVMDQEGHLLDLGGRNAHRLVSLGEATLNAILHPSSQDTLLGECSRPSGEAIDLILLDRAQGEICVRAALEPLGTLWKIGALDVSDLVEAASEIGHRAEAIAETLKFSERIRLVPEDRIHAAVHDQIESWVIHYSLLRAALLVRTRDNAWSEMAAYAMPGVSAFQGLDALLSDASDNTLPREAVVSGETSLSHGWLVKRLESLAGRGRVAFLPYRQQDRTEAILVFERITTPTDYLKTSDWDMLFGSVAAAIVSRLSEVERETERFRLDTLQQMLEGGWWELDIESGQITISPSLQAAWQLKAHAFGSIDEFLQHVHPAERDEFRLRFKHATSDQRPLTMDIRIQSTASNAGWRWYRAKAHYRPERNRKRIQGLLMDVDDIKSEETRASGAHARLQALLDSAPVVIYVLSHRDGQFETGMYSNAVEQILGWKREDLTRERLSELVHPDDLELYFGRLRTLLREGVVKTRYRMLDRAGAIHWLHDEVRLIRDETGQPVEAVGSWLDITEATLAAERIFQSEERYRVLVEDSPAMICRYKPDLTVVYANKTLANSLGVATEQLADHNLGDWLSEEQRSELLERTHALAPGIDPGSSEVSVTLANGERAWWTWTERGVFDSQGTLIEVLAVGRDDTELRQNRNLMYQSTKMAALGQMATGIAHEINQPLNVLRMAIGSMNRRMQESLLAPDYLQQKLELIDQQVVRAARIVDHMRVFGRKSEPEMLPFEPLEAIEGSLALVASGLQKRGVDIRTELPETLPTVRGFPDQLEQVFINLLVNAADAVVARQERSGGDAWLRVTAEADANAVHIHIADNGGGIDPAILPRIFEPFFTTKPVGSGTGLGLAISHGIVEQMGGKLTVHNAAEGAVFTVSLPVRAAV